MEISIFGFKLNVEILILIGVVYLILVGHTLCGCSNYSLMEGLDTMGHVATAVSSADMSGNKIAANIANGNANIILNITVLIIILVLLIILCVHVCMHVCSMSICMYESMCAHHQAI
jgi:hypothetical protein